MEHSNEIQKYNVNLEDFKRHMNKTLNNPCYICGQRSWSVGDTCYELREFNGGNFVVGGSNIIPIIPMTCANCGNTILINAMVAGFVEAE